MNHEQFKQQYIGQRIDFLGGFGYQSTDLIRAYTEQVWEQPTKNFSGMGGALTAFTDFPDSAIGDYANRIPYDPQNPNLRPKQGDIIVFGNSDKYPFGHLAIVEQTFPGEERIITLDQNAGEATSSGTGTDAISFKQHTFAPSGGFGEVLGWLTPKDSFNQTTILDFENEFNNLVSNTNEPENFTIASPEEFEVSQKTPEVSPDLDFQPAIQPSESLVEEQLPPRINLSPNQAQTQQPQVEFNQQESTETKPQASNLQQLQQQNTQAQYSPNQLNNSLDTSNVTSGEPLSEPAQDNFVSINENNISEIQNQMGQNINPEFFNEALVNLSSQDTTSQPVAPSVSPFEESSKKAISNSELWNSPFINDVVKQAIKETKDVEHLLKEIIWRTQTGMQWANRASELQMQLGQLEQAALEAQNELKNNQEFTEQAKSALQAQADLVTQFDTVNQQAAEAKTELESKDSQIKVLEEAKTQLQNQLNGAPKKEELDNLQKVNQSLAKDLENLNQGYTNLLSNPRNKSFWASKKWWADFVTKLVSIAILIYQNSQVQSGDSWQAVASKLGAAIAVILGMSYVSAAYIKGQSEIDKVYVQEVNKLQK